ncbi:MAG TPA: hypothetical protein VGD74_02720 [Vulgatibacter sp.]
MTRLAWLQGAWFAAAGLWPLVGMRSFERVTGPKRDEWLVETVGAVVLAIGGTLLFAAYRREESPPVRALGMGSSAALAAIELRHGLAGRISPVYLADAVLELGLVAGWVWTSGARSSRVDRLLRIRTQPTRPTPRAARPRT